MLLVLCILDFKIDEMDVNSAFLNNYIQEEVYVDQPRISKLISH